MAGDIFGNIVVTGVTGSGKSTLAAAIARRTGRCHIDLDDCHWRPGWREVPTADFLACIEAAMQQSPPQGWVVAGNYSKAEALIWGRAQTLVGLDYAWPVVFWRLLSRTCRRAWTGAPVCNGNRETFAKAFFSRDSILLWFFQTFAKRRRKLRALEKGAGGYPHLRILRHQTPKETTTWLNTL